MKVTEEEVYGRQCLEGGIQTKAFPDSASCIFLTESFPDLVHSQNQLSSQPLSCHRSQRLMIILYIFAYTSWPAGLKLINIHKFPVLYIVQYFLCGPRILRPKVHRESIGWDLMFQLILWLIMYMSLVTLFISLTSVHNSVNIIKI